ncbi:MAG: YqaA family protein [Arenicellales bacterium]|nr:YqaA family protein [Arenicellales bacterium]
MLLIMDPLLISLFTSGFLASTLLPGGSEILFIGLASAANHDPFELLLYASLGNTLGGISTWGLGWLLYRGVGDQWLRGRLKIDNKAGRRIRTYGTPLLLLSWLPVVGDPMCLAAGYLNTRFFLSLFFIMTGKTIRYALLLTLS